MSATNLSPGAAPARPALTQPEDAIRALCERIEPVPIERVPWRDAAGRVLAQSIVLDRDSPACDVSAMDGYAVRMAGLRDVSIPVRAEVQPGERAPAMPDSGAVRVFTGAMIPEGADAVVQREHVVESPDTIRLREGVEVQRGQHIRRRAENAAAGTLVCGAGLAVTPPRLAALSACGYRDALVRARVRVGVLVTGNEVLASDADPAPWELRDGNGAALAGLLHGTPWIDALPARRVGDRRDAIREAAAALLRESDALFVTGGVSAGDHDHVPDALRDLGFNIVFHKAAIRPGKPVLGAIDAQGRVALGLPGNPVSVLVTARYFGAAALRARAGFASVHGDALFVDVADDTPAPAGLRWFPLVRLLSDGSAAIAQSRGSGDWVAAGGADGFVEVPAGEPARGRRRFRAWRFDDGAAV